MEARNQGPSLALTHELLVFSASETSKRLRTCLELSSCETREVGGIFEAKLVPDFSHGQFRVQEETFGFQNKARPNQISRRQAGFKPKAFVQMTGCNA
jgi:hypothetical protein